MNKVLLDTKAAAAYLGGCVPPETLKQWRRLRKGPSYIKLPNGRVRYPTDSLDVFLEQHVINPTEVAA